MNHRSLEPTPPTADAGFFNSIGRVSSRRSMRDDVGCLASRAAMVLGPRSSNRQYRRVAEACSGKLTPRQGLINIKVTERLGYWGVASHVGGVPRYGSGRRTGTGGDARQGSRRTSGRFRLLQDPLRSSLSDENADTDGPRRITDSTVEAVLHVVHTAKNRRRPGTGCLTPSCTPRAIRSRSR